MTFREFLIELRVARAERGLTQRQLSDLIGVCRSSVGVWESGRSRPGLYAARRWCSVLDVELPDEAAGWFRPEWPECGTRRGYEYHRRRREDCGRCRAANAAYQRVWMAAKRAAA